MTEKFLTRHARYCKIEIHKTCLKLWRIELPNLTLLKNNDIIGIYDNLFKGTIEEITII